MFRNEFCGINKNIQRTQCHSYSQFLKHVMHEENKIKEVRAQEILMTSENPMIKAQKQNEEICCQLEKLSREKFLQEKHKVLLHQNESEIRELVAQIKCARIQKEVIEQKEFKESKMKEELEARQEEKKRYNEEYKRIEEINMQKEREAVKKKAAFRQDLLKQMQEKERERDLQKEHIAREYQHRKKLVDDIQQDMAKEKQYALEVKQMLRNDRDEYLTKLELYKRNKEVDDKEDERREMEFIRQRDRENILRDEKRKQVMQERAAVSERIGGQVVALQLEKQKHNDLLLELLIGERLAKDEERHKMRLEQQIQRAKSLREDFQRCFSARQQAVNQAREKEKQFAAEQLKLFLDVERKTNDIKNLKLPKNRQYRQDLLRAIEYKTWERDFEASQNQMQHEELLKVQKKRSQEIEAEKLHLLRKESWDTLKRLPRKAITEEHRSLLGLTCKETKEKVQFDN